MKKILYIAAVCIFCWMVYDSCSSGSSSDSASYSQSGSSRGSSRSSGKFSHSRLSDQSSLLGLLDGKTFEGYDGTRGQVRFNRSGGKVDGVGFTITSVQIATPKVGKISYYVPGYDISGYFNVVVTDEAITVHDSNGSNFIYE